MFTKKNYIFSSTDKNVVFLCAQPTPDPYLRNYKYLLSTAQYEVYKRAENLRVVWPSTLTLLNYLKEASIWENC